MNDHPLLAPQPKTPFQIIAVQFSGKPTTYFYRAPADFLIEPGDRVVVPNNLSFSIPHVVGVYPPGGQIREDEATDWVVQKIDTTRYEALKLEYAR